MTNKSNAVTRRALMATGATAARFALGWAPDAWQGLKAAFADYQDPRLADAGLDDTGC